MESPKVRQKRWKGSRKTWYPRARPGGRIQAKVERKTQWRREWRCVHSGVSNMWTGLSAWLAHHLRVNIEMKLLHLLRDTKEFVDDLKHVHGQDGMRMVKIDIKEFYMSRKRGFLSHACSELFCDETEDFQQLVAKAVDRL